MHFVSIPIQGSHDIKINPFYAVIVDYALDEESGLYIPFLVFSTGAHVSLSEHRLESEAQAKVEEITNILERMH